MWTLLTGMSLSYCQETIRGLGGGGGRAAGGWERQVQARRGKGLNYTTLIALKRCPIKLHFHPSSTVPHTLTLALLRSGQLLRNRSKATYFSPNSVCAMTAVCLLLRVECTENS